MNKKINTIIFKVCSPLMTLAAWEIMSRTGVLDIRFFPPPSLIFADIYKLFAEGILLKDIWISMFRICCGLLMGGLPGLILGVLMGRSILINKFFQPLIALTFPIPKLAIIPLIILLFGIGEFSKIFIVAVGVFFLIVINTFHGVSRIDRIYFDLCKIYKYSLYDRWRHIIIPGALPAIFNGLRLATGTAFILIVGSEFVAADSGIGYRIWVSWEVFQIIHMFSALFVLAFLGWAANGIIKILERWAMPWKTDYQRECEE